MMTESEELKFSLKIYLRVTSLIWFVNPLYSGGRKVYMFILINKCFILHNVKRACAIPQQNLKNKYLELYAQYYTSLTLCINKEHILGGILSKIIVLRCSLLTMK